MSTIKQWIYVSSTKHLNNVPVSINTFQTINGISSNSFSIKSLPTNQWYLVGDTGMLPNIFGYSTYELTASITNIPFISTSYFTGSYIPSSLSASLSASISASFNEQKLILQWQTLSGSTSYNIYSSDTISGSLTYLATINSGSVYEIDNVQYNQSVYYRVSTNDSSSLFSNVLNGIILFPPPVLSVSSSNYEQKNTLTWMQSISASSYTVSSSLISILTTGSSYIDIVPSGIEYDYVIYANNSTNSGSVTSNVVPTNLSICIDCGNNSPTSFNLTANMNDNNVYDYTTPDGGVYWNFSPVANLQRRGYWQGLYTINGYEDRDKSSYFYVVGYDITGYSKAQLYAVSQTETPYVILSAMALSQSFQFLLHLTASCAENQNAYAFITATDIEEPTLVWNANLELSYSCTGSINIFL